jgi:enhancing lycopene biosynthesis protein 2
MARVGVCLSGCGFLDGAEIHESVLTLLALDQAGAQIVCCAPDVDQAAVVNHLTGKPAEGQARNVLVESARIARGDIRDVATMKASDLDALILPGGFGAARNLCTFATDGPDCSVHPQVERLIGEMLDARKPVGAICIAPALLARILGRKGLPARLTIGSDPGTGAAIEQMGARHVPCACTSCVIDPEHHVVSTPAYMLAKGPAEVFEGVRKLVAEVLKMASA